LNQRVDRRPARRVVCTFHDLFVMTAQYSSGEYRERFTRQARVAARNADLILAVSGFTARQVQDLLDVPADRIRVVPHGVNPPARPRFTPPAPFVLSVGALQKRKNILRLVAAFEAMPDNWRLILAGSPNGYEAAEALAAIKRSRSASRIQVTGYVAQKALEELYASATIFAFPSLDEGFGIPVLEAMAHGVPVLTANNSALGELGRDVALLVDPRNVDEIAEGLRTLALNPDLQERFATLGKSKAAAYTWDRSVALTHSAYEEVAG
jgi:glycosyltransferase involved in cell wall biosynthesis